MFAKGCKRTFVHARIPPEAFLRMDMCRDMCIDMCINISTDIPHSMYRHVNRHVHKHVNGHVYRNVYGSAVTLFAAAFPFLYMVMAYLP